MMVQRARELCGSVQEEEQLPARREIPAIFWLCSGYVLAMFCRWSSIGSGNLYFSLEALGYFFQNLRVQ